MDGRRSRRSARQHPDLIVLDLGLRSSTGSMSRARSARPSNVPIVMLTGRSEESDKLVGLELGADDYVTKPFSPKELVARVRAVLRRMERRRPTPAMSSAPATSRSTFRACRFA